MEDTSGENTAIENCGDSDQEPCMDGCANGMTYVVVMETNGMICHTPLLNPQLADVTPGMRIFMTFVLF